MSARRILHVIDKMSVDGSKIAGPARQIAYRVPYYDSTRYQVRVCNLRNEGPGADLYASAGLDLVSLGRTKMDPRTLTDVINLSREWRPDVLHLSGYASWNFGRVAGKLLNIPFVLQEHFIDPAMPGYQRLADRALQSLRGVGLAVSKPVKRFMVRERHLPDEDIQIIWNSVPVAEFRDREPRPPSELRAELGIPAEAGVVGIVGRVAEMKGHEYFIRAADIVRRRVDPVAFVVVGEGPLRGELEEMVEELDLSQEVRFTGYQPDVLSYMSFFDVAVMASVYGEGFPAVPIEALAAGTPVVITDLAVFDDVYVDRENVLKVPVRDAPSLADAIVELLENPELGPRLVARGQETVQKCDTPHVAAQYTRLYERMLEDS